MLKQRLARRAILVLLVILPVIVPALPAFAACHMAAFVDDSVSVNESAGQATLTVELVGRAPDCAGTVEYNTVNGTATAPSDYTARQGTLSFATGDDREESIQVPIVNDTSDEPSERFTVRLSGGTGGISGDDTATVTIADNDPAPQPTTSSPRPSTPASARTKRAASSPRASTPASTPTATQSPTPLPTPTPTQTGTLQAAPAGDEGSKAGPIAALVSALVVLIGGGIWLFRRRATRA